MNPDVVAPNVNAIETTFIATTDSHVVNFTIRASVNGKVERRRVDQSNIMNRKIGDVPQSQDSRTRDAALLVKFIAVSLNGSLASRREHLEASVSVLVGRCLDVKTSRTYLSLCSIIIILPPPVPVRVMIPSSCKAQLLPLANLTH